jgi:Zn-dependent membrane protease YugP
MVAVGIAARESGHAIQDLKRYEPLIVLNIFRPIDFRHRACSVSTRFI